MAAFLALVQASFGATSIFGGAIECDFLGNSSWMTSG
jgi:hypothetical protein